MKNTIKLFGVIALAVLIGFSMTACDSGDDGGNTSQPGNPGTSTGTVWKTAANRSLDADVWDIAYGNNKFVVISKANTGVASKISYSSDGINWTEIPSNYSYRTKEALIIAFGNNTFVVGGQYSETSTSTDGVTWTNVTRAGIGEITAIAYGNGKFVAGGYGGGMAYSSDCITWTAVANSPFGNSKISKIVWGNNIFVAGGSNKMAYSADGITWTAVTNITFLGAYDSIASIAYGNGKYVAGSSYGKMAYSSDGITWTAVANSPFSYPYNWGDPYFDLYDVVSTSINAIAYGNGKFVVGGPSKTAYWSGK